MLSKYIAKAYLNLTGWTVRNDLPEGLDKFVIIAAPHTSNWDFPVTMAIAATVDMEFRWVGKHTMFRWPAGGLMRRLGGIAVDRRKSNNFVEQIAQAFREADRMALGIAPEGTRSRGEYWKSGFYYIAREAGVPIVCGYVDFEKKEGGLGPVIDATQSKEAVLDEIRDFYRGVQGCRPDQFTPPKFRDHAE
jgi:1-acyl-sn-glycerol-3-phosphate acyltransferase